jgi:hypothetical protein
MSDFDNTKRGALFSNKDCKETETDPDYSGTINVAGEEYWLKGWLKTSKAGQKFLSLSVRLKRAEPKKTDRRAEFSDEVPF